MLQTEHDSEVFFSSLLGVLAMIIVSFMSAMAFRPRADVEGVYLLPSATSFLAQQYSGISRKWTLSAGVHVVIRKLSFGRVGLGRGKDWRTFGLGGPVGPKGFNLRVPISSGPRATNY